MPSNEDFRFRLVPVRKEETTRKPRSPHKKPCRQSCIRQDKTRIEQRQRERQAKSARFQGVRSIVE